jgi:hypothetical protein
MQNIHDAIEHIFNPVNLKVQTRKNKQLKLKKVSKMFTENITLILKSSVIVRSMGQVSVKFFFYKFYHFFKCFIIKNHVIFDFIYIMWL